MTNANNTFTTNLKIRVGADLLKNMSSHYKVIYFYTEKNCVYLQKTGQKSGYKQNTSTFSKHFTLESLNIEQELPITGNVQSIESLPNSEKSLIASRNNIANSEKYEQFKSDEYSQLSPCGRPAIAETRYYGQNSDPHLQ